MYLDMSRIKRTLFLLTICFNVGHIIGQAMQDAGLSAITTKDYCIGKPVNVSCGPNKVFLAHNATYGRMELGTCIKTNVGFLGCAAGALDVLDRHCSGRPSCNMMVPNDDLTVKETGCSTELNHYLSASYTCERVYPISRSFCGQPIEVHVTPEGGHISSLASKLHDCNPMSPITWILKAEPGQVINLTLVDFDWSTDPIRQRSCYQTYGYIKKAENEEKIAICGGRQRKRQLYTSEGLYAHTLEVVVNPKTPEPYNFLVKYQAIGCPDLMPPKDAWLTRELGSVDAIIGCRETKQTWHLRCVNNQWQGVIGNCTQQLMAVLLASRKMAVDSRFPNAFLIFIIISIAFVISAAIIAIGILILQRFKEPSRGVYRQPPAARVLYEEAKYQGKSPIYEIEVQKYPASTATVISGDLNCPRPPKNEYTHIWEYPLPEPVMPPTACTRTQSDKKRRQRAGNNNNNKNVKNAKREEGKDTNRGDEGEKIAVEVDKLLRYYALDTEDETVEQTTTIMT